MPRSWTIRISDERRARLGDLLDRDRQHQRAGAGAAVLLPERQSEDVVLGQQLADVPRVLGARVDVVRARRDPLLGDLADRVAEVEVLLRDRVGVGGDGGHGEQGYGPRRGIGSAGMTWEPELEELRRRRALAHRMGGEERVARQHAQGKLTVRERVDRLLDEGSFHETGELAGVGDVRRGRRARRLPAREHGRRPGPDRGPPRGRPGRRLHRPRRRGRRGHLAEARLGRAGRARAARAARAARRRHRRRRQRQDARDDGLLLRPAAARVRVRRREPLARSGRRGGARAVRGPRRRAGDAVALLGDRARQRAAVRRGATGRRGGDGRVPGQGDARRLARPDPRGRRGQRGRRRGRRARPAAPVPLVPARERLGGTAGRRRDSTTPSAASTSCAGSCRATRGSPTTCDAPPS